MSILYNFSVKKWRCILLLTKFTLFNHLILTNNGTKLVKCSSNGLEVLLKKKMVADNHFWRTVTFLGCISIYKLGTVDLKLSPDSTVKPCQLILGTPCITWTQHSIYLLFNYYFSFNVYIENQRNSHMYVLNKIVTNTINFIFEN